MTSRGDADVCVQIISGLLSPGDVTALSNQQRSGRLENKLVTLDFSS